MAAIVDRLKEKIKAQGGSAAGVQTISQALKALGGERHGEDVAEAIKASGDITISSSGSGSEEVG